MSLAEANLSLPDNFTGVVRVFPLPNLVLFPGVIQPLHIFEPRYRQLMCDALAGDELIAMSLLKPQWTDSESSNPPIFPTICIGKIVTHARLEDGRYNLLLLGARRARVIREIPTNQPYRMVEVKVLEDETNKDPELYRGPIRNQTVKLFRQLIANDHQLDRESIENLLCDELPFGLLLDLIAFSCGAGLLDQQSVLSTTDVLTRANKVISILETKIENLSKPAYSKFPPEFSFN